MRTAEEIAVDWIAAKTEEKDANAKRIAFEEELIQLLGSKEEGTTSHDVGNFKIKIRGNLKRKIDWERFDTEVASKLPASLQPVKIKREVDDAGVRYLQNNEPQLYRLLSTVLTVEPAKTYVEIKEME